jgi:hypothetical protein
MTQTKSVEAVYRVVQVLWGWTDNGYLGHETILQAGKKTNRGVFFPHIENTRGKRIDSIVLCSPTAEAACSEAARCGYPVTRFEGD